MFAGVEIVQLARERVVLDWCKTVLDYSGFFQSYAIKAQKGIRLVWRMAGEKPEDGVSPFILR